MKTRQTIAPGLLALTLGAAALPAWAGDDCDVPLQRWQSREAVRRMAVEKGWELQRLKIDDGCYEVRGRDAEGRRFKAKLDPETLEPVSMKWREGSDDSRQGRERERHREHAPGEPAASPGASPASPLFTPGSKPRAQVE